MTALGHRLTLRLDAPTPASRLIVIRQWRIFQVALDWSVGRAWRTVNRNLAPLNLFAPRPVPKLKRAPSSPSKELGALPNLGCAFAKNATADVPADPRCSRTDASRRRRSRTAALLAGFSPLRRSHRPAEVRAGDLQKPVKTRGWGQEPTPLSKWRRRLVTTWWRCMGERAHVQGPPTPRITACRATLMAISTDRPSGHASMDEDRTFNELHGCAWARMGESWRNAMGEFRIMA